MSEATNQESLFKQLFGKVKMPNFATVLTLLIIGIGAIFVGVKSVKDVFLTKFFELEVRFIGEKFKEGDKVIIEPLNIFQNLDNENKIIYRDDVERIQNRTISLTLLPAKGEQEKLISYHVRNSPDYMLFIYNFQNQK